MRRADIPPRATSPYHPSVGGGLGPARAARGRLRRRRAASAPARAAGARYGGARSGAGPARVVHRRARAANRSEFSFEEGGRILERHVDVGTRVRKGQPIASLDPRDFRNALRSAEANEARAYYERVVEASKFGAVSEKELTDAESQLRSTEATLRIRRKDLATLYRLHEPAAGDAEESGGA